MKTRYDNFQVIFIKKIISLTPFIKNRRKSNVMNYVNIDKKKKTNKKSIFVF